MANIFIRTSIAPYRIDIYNALHEKMNMKMCFYRRTSIDQHFDEDKLESLCHFTPTYLKGIELGGESRKFCFGLWKLIRKEQPEVIIVPEFQIVFFQIWLIRLLSFKRSKKFKKFKKFKIISMCDDSINMISENNDFTRIHKLLRSFIPRMLDDLILVQPQVQEWYQKKFHKGIWLPILMDEKKAVKRFEELLPLSNSVNKKFQLEGKKVLVFVGRLVALKNIHRLMEAFSRTQEEAVLVIIGEGPEEENLKKYANEIPKRIIFTGRLEGDSLFLWYNISDILLLVSTQEAFGAVTNEALLAGNRVIISKNTGSSCLVSSNNGVLVDPYNIEEISKAMDEELKKVKKSDELVCKHSLMNIDFETCVDACVDKCVDKCGSEIRL